MVTTVPPRPQPGRKEPPPGLAARLDSLGRAAFPGCSTAVLMVLAHAPVGLPPAVAAITLPAVFFWSVFRPGAMAPPVVFTLGLLLDLLTLAPLGSGIVALLLVHGCALRWRRFIARQSFLTVWLIFCAFALGAASLLWALQALLSLSAPPFAPALDMSVLAAGLYPAMAHLMTRAHEAMRRGELTP